MPAARRFLVLHGWQNRRPQQHWQWQLTEQLRARGEQVLYPQLPDTDRPALDDWREVLHAELAQLGDGERVVVAHSLSVLLWLAAAPGLAAAERVDRVLLVAPPSPAVLESHDEVAGFLPVRQDATATATATAAAAGSTRLVCGDDDPYCPQGAAVAYAGLGLSTELDVDVIGGGRHLDLAAGYGRWPAVLAWCLDPRTRLTAR